jgi:hypothetical protein
MESVLASVDEWRFDAFKLEEVRSAVSSHQCGYKITALDPAGVVLRGASLDIVQ